MGWQVLLAVVCLGLVLALLSYQAQTAGLCSTRVPAAGGTVAEGMVGAPRYLNPLLSDNNPVDREIASLLFDGLTRYNSEGRLVPALASEWTVGDGGREVQFTLRRDASWHDGTPVTAADVLFTYGLLQSEEFPAAPGLRSFWQMVEMSSSDDHTVTFALPEPYSPFLEATTRGLLPAHILGDVAPDRIADHEFNRQPVGTGPLMVAPGDNWQRTGRLHLVPSRSVWPQGIKLDSIEFRFFPDTTTLFEAYQSGEIEAINRVPPSLWTAVSTEPHTRLYSALLPRYTQLMFNLSEQGATALDSQEVRHALAYALDREQLIDEALNGQAVPVNGPYLTSSWAYSPDALTLYPHQPLSATTLLENEGWTLPEGGAIREGEAQTLILRLVTPDIPRQRAVADAVARQWSEVGVGVDVVALDSPTYAEALRNREFDVALTEVAAPGDPDLYDFWSQEAIVRGQNYAWWNSRRASEMLEQGRQLWDREERRPYYETFQRFFTLELPAIPLYQPVYTYAVSDAVEQLEIGRIDNPRDRYETLADWFVLYRDVAVYCPEPEATP